MSKQKKNLQHFDSEQFKKNQHLKYQVNHVGSDDLKPPKNVI